ncbi:MAG: acetyl-CoA carboxylase, carboxyltransferase subunit beta [Ruminococcaceae bacterium]|nr:acetyl-CoA carboxylase, carboxyltransferase subunit beta [Oscillospiraceae bacterium]
MFLNKTMFLRPKNKLEDDTSPQRDRTVTCPSCRNKLPIKEIADTLKVCDNCEYHFEMHARERIEKLFDAASFEEIMPELTSRNILSFPDYDKKLSESMSRSNENESVIIGTATVDDRNCAVFSMEYYFMMGSMGAVTGEKITSLFEYAAEHDLPVVGFCLSGGARIQEGVISLMQMAKVSGAVERHGRKGLFYLSVLLNPTTGGVTASFATQGDIILAEPNALIGFAGPRVIEQTMRKSLPKGFQRAEFLKDRGFIDKIVDRRDLRDTISLLLSIHSKEK